MRAVAHRIERRRAILAARSFGSGGNIGDWYASEAYALRMVREADQLRRSLAAAERDREAATERYRRARQNVDVLERLRERRQSVHTAAERRLEQHTLDEVGQRIAAGQKESR